MARRRGRGGAWPPRATAAAAAAARPLRRLLLLLPLLLPPLLAARAQEQGGGAGLDCFQQLQGLALCAADAAAPEAQAACCELAGALDAVSPPRRTPSSRPRHSEPAAHRTATPRGRRPAADPLDDR